MAVLGGIESLVASGIGGIIVFILLEYLRRNFATTTVVATLLAVILAIVIFQGVAYWFKRSGQTMGGGRRNLVAAASVLVAGVASVLVAQPLTTGLSYAWYDISGALLPEQIDMSDWRLVIFGLILMLTLRFSQNGLLYPIIQRVSRAGSLSDTVAKRDAARAVAEAEAS
jgi:ABC-type branched-subunit amino acid transport system permease subunit